MANEIRYSFSLSVTNGELKDSYSSGNLASDQASARVFRSVINLDPAVGSGYQAMGTGTIAVPGYAVFVNLDDTNFVDIGIEVSGAFHSFLKLGPGQQAGPMPLGATSLFGRANTAALDVMYIVYGV